MKASFTLVMVQCSYCWRRRASRNCSITLLAATTSPTFDRFTAKI